VAARLSQRVLRYPGLKEDVYVGRLRADPGVLERLAVNPADTVVILRPPATEAHYHTPKSEALFETAMERLRCAERTCTVVLPRNARQRSEIAHRWAGALRGGRMVMPEHALDGLGLLWQSDLVISGGGTMNREAAALGLPVYSIFGGRIGAVDRYLASANRLVLVAQKQDVYAIPLVKRSRNTDAPAGNPAALQAIVNGILSALGRSEPIDATVHAQH
jgi:predicted glycosyltransferase